MTQPSDHLTTVREALLSNLHWTKPIKCDSSGINPQWVSGVIGIHVEATQLHRAPSSGAAATLQCTTTFWPLKVQWLVTSFKCNLHGSEIPELNSVDSFPLSLNRAEEQLKRVTLKRLVPL